MDLVPSYIGKALDHLPFNEIVKAVNSFKYGSTILLPHVSHIYSTLPTINPHNLIKCVNAKTLILPRCRHLTDQYISPLSKLQRLTVLTGSGITENLYQFLPELTSLELLPRLSKGDRKIVNLNDHTVTSNSIKKLTGLQYLYISSNGLQDADIAQLTNLKYLIINGSGVTCSIMNTNQRLELFVLNGVIYKYKASNHAHMVLNNLHKTHDLHLSIYAVHDI